MRKQEEYKLTETGKIPIEWELLRLDALLSLEYGKGLPERARLEGIYPVIGSAGIVGYHHKALVKGPGLVIGRKGTIGAISRIKSDFWPIDTTYYVKTLVKDIDLKWLFYALIKLNLPKLNLSDVVPGLKRELVHSLKLPIPPFPEQQKIAEILMTVDEAIEKVDEAIKKTQRMKKGLMQELLTQGIGHKEFKDTEIGTIPKEWELLKLTDLAEKDNNIVAGPFGSNLKVCDYRQEGAPIIRLQNIERNQFIKKDIKYISPEKSKELSYHSFRAGDIVLAKLGDPIGKACIVPDFLKEGIVVADVVRIRVSPEKAIKYFVEYILNSSICVYQLKKETIGSTRPRVNICQVRNLKLPLPPLSEQQKIAEILSTVDSRLEMLRKRKGKIERIKKGLMNDLLTGRKRVKLDS